MIKRMVAAWLLLGVLLGWTNMKPDPYGLQPVINAFQYDGVDTRVVWRECGEVNAYYIPARQEVVLCTELELLRLTPGVMQHVVAHELAHGVIVQRNIPYTGSGEVAADELSSYVLHAMGYDQALREAARWYALRNEVVPPYDDHPSDMKRAVMLMEIAEGSPRVTWTWNYLLELPHGI
jgi:putative metallopeptidase DUF4344